MAWRQRRGPGDHRPRAERVVTELLLLDPGRVGRMRHVDRDRQIRLEGEGGGASPVGADLLLDRGHRGHARRRALRARGRDEVPRARRRPRFDRPVSAKRADRRGKRHRLGRDHRPGPRP